MALFLYLAGAVVEMIETTHRGFGERDGGDEAISRHHEHCAIEKLNSTRPAGEVSVG